VWTAAWHVAWQRACCDKLQPDCLAGVLAKAFLIYLTKLAMAVLMMPAPWISYAAMSWPWDHPAPPWRRRTGSIAGTIFGDLSNNGLLDAGESGIQGAVDVQLQANNGLPMLATVNADGSFIFPLKAAGTYTLTFIVAPTFAPSTTAALSRTITLAAGSQNVQNLGVLKGARHSPACPACRRSVELSDLKNNAPCQAAERAPPTHGPASGVQPGEGGCMLLPAPVVTALHYSRPTHPVPCASQAECAARPAGSPPSSPPRCWQASRPL